MGYTKNEPTTFDLKLSLNSDNCPKRVKKCVKKIKGVDSVEIIDQEQGKVRISGNVDPDTVIAKLKTNMNIRAELWGKEEESPPKPVWEFVDHQLVALLLLLGIIVINYTWRYVSNMIYEMKPVALLLLGIIVINYIWRYVSDMIYEMKKAIHDTNHIITQLARKVHDCYPPHDHELELKSFNKPFTCNRCMQDGFTSGYRCNHCVYDIHKKCKNPKPKITRKLFPGSVFEFRLEPHIDGSICDACGMIINGYCYSNRCEARKRRNLDLHPRCSNLPGKLCFGGTDFKLICKNVKQRCFWCKMKLHSRLVKEKVPGWCYVSEGNKFYCHVYCVSQMVQEAWRKGDLVPNHDDDDDGISKALEKVNLKLVAKSNGSGGRGGREGRLFLKAATAFLGILFGDPSGLFLFAVTELVQN